MSPRRVAAKYFQSWFLLDFISSVPWDLALPMLGELSVLQMAKLFKMGKVLKVLKLLRISKMLKLSDEKAAFLEEVLAASAAALAAHSCPPRYL